MSCRFRNTYGCYSLTCSCCLDVDEACSWIAVVGLVWSILATLVDFISANLPEYHCPGCLDHALNTQLSVAAAFINAVQCLASVLLLIGAKLANRWLLLAWLAWGVVSLTMQGVWLGFTLPHAPSVRAAASVFQLAWVGYFFLVVRTQYKKLALTSTLPEEIPLIVPPNTPVRRNKSRWRKIQPASQPPIRTLLGAAQRLQRALRYMKKVKEWETDDEEQDEENEEEILVTVCQGSESRGTCSRRVTRGERTNGDTSGEKEEWETEDEEEEEEDEEEICDAVCPGGLESRGTCSRRRAADLETTDEDERAE